MSILSTITGTSPIGSIISEVGQTVREFIKDPDKQAQLDFQLKELADKAQARETALLQGQIDTNKEEAKNANLFVSGWRPFIGWICGGTLAYTWIVAPLGKAVFHLAEMPALSPDAVYPIVLGMLGLGVQRTWEKMNGVATSLGGKVLQPVEKAEVKPVENTDKPVEVQRSNSRWFNR